jgi:hypothetical protein
MRRGVEEAKKQFKDLQTQIKLTNLDKWHPTTTDGNLQGSNNPGSNGNGHNGNNGDISMNYCIKLYLVKSSNANILNKMATTRN